MKKQKHLILIGYKMAIQQTKLKNGLRILTNRMPDVESVSMGVYVGTGCRSETAAENGIAHFIEHMMFKGTKKRNSKEIVEAIERVGGNVNAYTSRELTVYHTKSLKEDFETCLDVLADMMQNSTFDKAEFAQEQNVILQEIAQNFDSPDDAIHDEFQRQAYGENAMGKAILGTNETIMAMTPDHLFNFVHKNYTTDNLVLAAAGNINHDDFVEKVDHYFQDLKQSAFTVPEKSVYQGGEIKTKRDIEQLQLMLGYPGTHYGADDYYDFIILSIILGGGMSSRLFQEIREKRGLAYSIYAYNANFKDSGMLCVGAALNADKAGDILPIISEELHKMTNNITDEEIIRAKTQIKSSLLMAQESSMSRCEKLGHHMLIHGRIIEIPELVQKIDTVTKDSIITALNKSLSGTKTLAALGPAKAVEHKDLSLKALN